MVLVYALKRNYCKHSTSSFTPLFCSQHKNRLSTYIRVFMHHILWSEVEWSTCRAFGIENSIQTLSFENFPLTQAYVNKSVDTHTHAHRQHQQSNKNQAYRFVDMSRKINARCMYRQPVKWNWNLFKHVVGKLPPKTRTRTSKLTKLRLSDQFMLHLFFFFFSPRINVLNWFILHLKSWSK